MEKTPGEITLLLKQVAGGNTMATETLAEAVYAELRKDSHAPDGARAIQPYPAAHPTGRRSVPESDRPDRAKSENRAHFFAVAAQAMRRILVDYSRRKRFEARRRVAPSRAGQHQRCQLLAPRGHPGHRRSAHRLSRIDSRQSRIVELRYFGGLTETEVAKVLGISDRTAEARMAGGALVVVRGIDGEASAMGRRRLLTPRRRRASGFRRYRRGSARRGGRAWTAERSKASRDQACPRIGTPRVRLA